MQVDPTPMATSSSEAPALRRFNLELRKVLCTLMLLSLGLCPNSSSAQAQPSPRKMVFEISVKKDSPAVKTLLDALSIVLGKKAIEAEYINYPARRGLEELRGGRIDGSVGRVGNLNHLIGIDSLVRIDVPIVVMPWSLWCGPTEAAMKQLKRPRLGFPNGNLAAMMLVDLVDDPSIVLNGIGSLQSLVTMLNKKRLDCIIGPEKLFKVDGVSSEDLQQLNRHDLVNLAAYPWITSKHIGLKAHLETELRNFPFPESWKAEYQNPESQCKNPLDALCPDGRIFTKSTLLNSGKASKPLAKQPAKLGCMTETELDKEIGFAYRGKLCSQQYLRRIPGFTFAWLKFRQFINDRLQHRVRSALQNFHFRDYSAYSGLDFIQTRFRNSGLL